MADAPSSTAWHPALMPNSHAPPPAAEAAAATPEAPAESTAEPVAPGSAQDAESRHAFDPESGRDTADAWFSKDGDDDNTNSGLASEVAEHPTHSAPQGAEAPAHQASADAWFSQDGDGDDSKAWLASEEVQPSIPSAPQEAEAPAQQASADALWFSQDGDGDDAHALLAPEQAQPDDGAKARGAQEPSQQDEQFHQTQPLERARTPTNAQHSSSMSFARTVSHELSFGDDDDGEWNLARPDTNVFGFMPPSSRTNSFPPVPPRPVAADAEEQHGPSLTSTHLLDVMEEADKEAETEQHHVPGRAPGAGSEAPSEDPEAGLDEPAASWSIGGEIQEPEAQASEARYEEGIPLISHVDNTGDAAGEGSTGAFANSFADDGNGDDFFTQIQESGSQRDEGADIKPIERKSTMQAMGATNPEVLSHHTTLEESIAEHEETHAAESKGEHDSLGISREPDGQGEQAKDQAAAEDLANKWQEAFAGDDDDDGGFLLEDSTTEAKEIDAAAFLGSDDEGFLDDTKDAVPEPRPAPAVSAGQQAPAPNPYTPASVASQQPPPSYMPPTAAPVQSYPYQQLSSAPFGSAPPGQAPQPRPDPSKTQSFADKSKGGYSSPYDLPTDLVSNTVKPRKRASAQQLPRDQAPPPPRSTSMFSPGHPPSAGSPPGPGQTAQGSPLNPKGSAAALRSQNAFFEDLPVTSKSRPSSRQNYQAQPPTPSVPAGQQPQSTPPMAVSMPHPPAAAAPQPSGVGNLVAPQRVSPYAAIPSSPSSVPPPSGSASRYSPAQPRQPTSQGAPPPAASTRYAAAPPGPRPGGSYGPAGPAASSQTVLPHLPRTSSPLAHFEASNDKLHGAGHATPNGDAHHFERRASANFEPRLNRVSSLPPTREVDEEEEDGAASLNRSFSAAQEPPPSNRESTHSPALPQAAARQTPPPPQSNYKPSVTSPLRRPNSYYAPQTAPATQHAVVPPPRASTQSPGSMHSGRQYKPAGDAVARPSSAHSSAGPALARTSQPAYASTTRIRGQSLSMNMVAPTDGREHDPLERWKGTPLITWGVGGTVVTSFPKSIPRYTMNQTAPTILRASGEVKAQNMKEIDPLPDRLARFPGPLKGKSKKREALAWLAAGIDAQAKELPDVSFHPQLSLEAKRGIERLVLWKLLRIFVEFDGTLEGSPAVEKAVRDILSPEPVTSPAPGNGAFPAAPAVGVQPGPVTSMQADGVDAAAIEQIRLNLLGGDRETAVWAAVDKRLWGHAMLISHTVSTDLYKRVAQEFVRKEVNYPGHNNEPIAALYKVLSGNFDECVDELVPIHARAGLRLVSTESTSEPARDAIDGLDKWRETLTLVLSNRSVEDVRGLNALGKLLSSYGRAEAAQICFIFSRSLSIFGGLDDPNADFVLLGADHRQQSDQFAKETEALLLSEVYEYGLSLAGGGASAAGAPHLAAYKLQHAVTLAEFGYRDKALQYCDAITAAMVSQTRRSPYHHAILEAAVDDFMTRLKQAPKEMSSSWISKPSMNKVSDSMWNRFNKFVAGDEGDNSGNGGAGEAENGPFSRMTTSPNRSRPPSVSNFEPYAAASPGYSVGAAPLASAASSRYAPAAQPAGMANPYAPVSPYAPAAVSSARTSNEYSRNAYEPAYPGTSSSPAPNSGGYVPAGYPSSGPVYQPAQPETAPPVASELPAARPPPASAGYQPYGLQPHGLQESPSIYPQAAKNEADASPPIQGYQPPSYGYEPSQMTAVVGDEGQARQEEDGGTGGYEPPSYQPYGYEPPSYQPVPESPTKDGDDAAKRKKKSFMDDDEDDILALRPQGKTKSEKDRENEDMFRRVAEEDAKRAAAQQTAKKGWGFSGWFGVGKKNGVNLGESSPNKPIRAKLGEASSFVYDPELKRWVNKKPGAENAEAKKATPPPPRSIPRSANATPPPGSSPTPPQLADGRPGSMPPPATGPLRVTPSLGPQPSQESLGGPMSRSVSNSGAAAVPPNGPSSAPPSRPPTSMSNASSIDDLLGPPASRKGAAQKKPRKSGRYVDVMAK